MSWREVLQSWSRSRTANPWTIPSLGVERLEGRTMLDATASLMGTTLLISGGAGRDRIDVLRDDATNQLIVQDSGRETGRFASTAVTSISVAAGAGDDIVRIDPNVLQPATLDGGPGEDVLYAGGGSAMLLSNDGNDKLVGGPNNDLLLGGPNNDFLLGRRGANILDGGPGQDEIFLGPVDTLAAADSADRVYDDLADLGIAADQVLQASEVSQLLSRAAAASSTNDAIIAIVDRNGTILGVRVESGVAPEITGDMSRLVFAVDGAVAKARTGAFFANNQAPLTSRTVQFISQSSITEREVNSIPTPGPGNPTDGTLFGPGFVSPIGIKSHFPPDIMFTPQVDLLYIEHTNRDNFINPGADGFKNAVGDIALPSRFNADFVPGKEIPPPLSYGDQILPPAAQMDPTIIHFQQRGIATLPGGIPIVKNGQVVGGIGVFFPGRTGFASEENSNLSVNHDPTRADRSLEAEYIAFAAVGGSSQAGASIGALGGVAALPGFDLPFGRIDLVGITLDLFGPGGNKGLETLLRVGQTVGVGNPASGTNLPVNAGGDLFLAGRPVPDGWLVAPHDGVNVTAADVERIITQGVAEAQQVRAAIRLPLSSRTRMVFAVTDVTGEVLGLFRMPDATFFSIDVAVAKARNTAYYADPTSLQPADQLTGLPPGAAFTNRTFRYLAQPRFPEGIDGSPPGPFSILNDGGANLLTGLNVGPPLPASAFQSVVGYDAFHPGTNFRDPNDLANQNGIVWFPGSTPIYQDVTGTGLASLVGGFGVSGDGVDQDDVVTFGGSLGYQVPPYVPRADQLFFRGVRLPFQKFNRNPLGG